MSTTKEAHLCRLPNSGNVERRAFLPRTAFFQGPKNRPGVTVASSCQLLLVCLNDLGPLFPAPVWRHVSDS